MGMIGRRKRVFFELVGQLHAIEADQGNLRNVEAMNFSILKAVVRTERDIARHKGKLKGLKARLRTDRPDREQSKALRRRIKITQYWITHYSEQLWLWKLFGDALAYIYLDKFSIKHAFFETERFRVKADAGLVHGKAGLENEVGLLLSAIEHGVPAVLCDITNVLRYGDVCLLGASDPHLLEVKSSERLNQRGKRQAETLQKLHDFLANDHAAEFRGAPGETLRKAIDVPERTYVDELNEAIALASEQGNCIVSPEPGLHYAIVYGGGLPDFASIISSSEPPTVGFSWNESKMGLTWAPYVPFLLTIRNPQHLYAFVEGRLHIMIFASAGWLASLMSEYGWFAQFSEHEAYAIHAYHPETGGLMSISRQFVSRIGFECCSLRWVAESQATLMTETVATQLKADGLAKIFQAADQVPNSFGIDYKALIAEYRNSLVVDTTTDQ